jgi:hypothetical protein
MGTRLDVTFALAMTGFWKKVITHAGGGFVGLVKTDFTYAY